MSYLAEFTTDIRHVPGVDNVVADTLFRPTSVVITGPDSCQPAHHVAAVSPSLELLDYISNARNQLTCPSTAKAQSSSSLRLMHINVQGQQLLCDVSKRGQRPLIPKVDRSRFSKLSTDCLIREHMPCAA